MDPQTDTSNQKYIFQFKGHADIVDEYDEPLSGERISLLVSELNERSSSIGNGIRHAVETSLPEEFDIQVGIEFSQGSIELIGAVILTITTLDWLSRISGTIDFFEKMAKLVQFAIEGSVRRSVRKGVTIKSNTFQVTVIPPIVLSPTNETLPSTLDKLLKRQNEISRLQHLIIQNQNKISHQIVQDDNNKENTLKLYGIVGLLLITIIISQFCSLVMVASSK